MTDELNSQQHEKQPNSQQPAIDNVSTIEIGHSDAKDISLIETPQKSEDSTAPPPPPSLAPIIQAPPPPPLPRPASIRTLPQPLMSHHTPNGYQAPSTSAPMPLPSQQPPQNYSNNPMFQLQLASFMHRVQSANNEYLQKINNLIFEFQMMASLSGGGFPMPSFQPPMLMNFGLSNPMMPQVFQPQQAGPFQIPQQPQIPDPPKLQPTASQKLPSQSAPRAAPANLLEEIQAAGGIEFLRRKKSAAKLSSPN